MAIRPGSEHLPNGLLSASKPSFPASSVQAKQLRYGGVAKQVAIAWGSLCNSLLGHSAETHTAMHKRMCHSS
jgi:hypothetical protein